MTKYLLTILCVSLISAASLQAQDRRQLSFTTDANKQYHVSYALDTSALANQRLPTVITFKGHIGGGWYTVANQQGSEMLLNLNNVVGLTEVSDGGSGTGTRGGAPGDQAAPATDGITPQPEPGEAQPAADPAPAAETP